jgi:chemotaxis protein methyltransferase CheR
MSLAHAHGHGDDYEAFCAGLQRLAGVELSSYKRGQMERRIRGFADSRGKPELLDYLALLAHDQSELEQFLDRMTINVSQLWRNPLQWRALAERVIPRLAHAGRIRAGAPAAPTAPSCSRSARSAARPRRGSSSSCAAATLTRG